MTRSQHVLSAFGALAAVLLHSVAPVAAQVQPLPSINQMDWQLRTVRESGQPVIPFFNGWYENPDGTYEMCFGFFNMNRTEAVDIPVGPDNFIEPERYNGGQPTHFTPLGPRPAGGFGNMEPEYCVFTVNVPADIGDTRVWWNLRLRGQTYRVPGHVDLRPYKIDNLVNSVGSAMESSEANRGVGGVAIAPNVRFISPAGPTGRGKTAGINVGPVTVRGGAPLPLTIAVARPDGAEVGLADVELLDEDVSSRQLVKWSQFRGPEGGVATLTPPEAQIALPSEHTTQVTFSQPGDYVLLAQVLDGSFTNLCCWTNAYVRVTVQ